MPITKQLLLIRHATTDLAGTLCGHLDPPLNRIGRAQALSLAHSLGAVAVQRVYASDLLRSIQTAEPLARARSVPILARRDLREISFGAWEGMRSADLQIHNGLAPGAIESSPEARPPGGESFKDFRDRATAALEEIVFDPGQQTVAAVTHLGVIRVALTVLAGLDPLSDALRRIECCSVHQFFINNGTWRFRGHL